MRKPPYPIYVSKLKEHSFSRFAIRARKDTWLHNDAEDFMIKNPANLIGLVNMLINDHFLHARYTDPEYPM
jgi:hypothetical protein